MYCWQVVTEEMWAQRSESFPEETPSTKEYYLLRSIFEEHFPSQSALDTVPKVSGYISNVQKCFMNNLQLVLP